MKKISVLLCDDHAVVREGLRCLLEAAGDIQVVGEAENGLRAVAEAKRVEPDVVLMDLAMPLLNGVEATRRIAREVAATKVLILSFYSDELHVQQAAAAGAAGYLIKQTAAKDLVLAIRAACNGNATFSPPPAKIVRQQRNGRLQSTTTAAPVLSPRQREFLQLIGEGYSTRKIAGLLSLSIKTAEKHRQALMAHLDMHKTAALTRYAVSSGVVECKPCALAA